jgi:hypothetical protein
VGDGRFLLRVSYVDLSTSSAYTPTSKYLKIESVGAEGVVNPDDPTSSVAGMTSSNRRAERTAYKPIGLGDYSLFVTNKDNRSDVASIGVPSVITNPSTASTTTAFAPGTYNGITQGAYSVIPADSSGDPTIQTPLLQVPIQTNFGAASSVASSNPGGGSIRCNGDLRLYGKVNVYLDATQGEGIQTSGKLLFDGFPFATSDTNSSITIGSTSSPN